MEEHSGLSDDFLQCGLVTRPPLLSIGTETDLLASTFHSTCSLLYLLVVARGQMWVHCELGCFNAGFFKAGTWLLQM